MNKTLRIVVGVVAGYALMVALITLVQEVWLGGIAWNKTPPGILMIGGLLTCVAGAIGAAAATAIAKPSGLVAARIMAGVVVLETTVLIATGRLTGPLWFDLVSSASLIVAILLGGALLVRRFRSAPSAPVERVPFTPA